jgi:uncharacterized protein (TIGR03437 family)
MTPEMRTVFVILSLGAALFAQNPFQFRTGQAARAVVGQPTFTAQSPGDPPSASILGASGGLAYANGVLVVADASRFGAAPNNNRVLIYREITRQVPAQDAEIAPDIGRCPICTGVADVVIGQREFTTVNVAVTAQGMRSPTAVATDGTAIAVADTDNNRVLIWRSIPTTNGQPADVVLGQENFTSIKRLVTDSRSFRGPQGVWIQHGRLYVADTQNHRVMVWNSIPTQNHAAADFVLGQPNFTTAPEVDLTKPTIVASATSMLNPVSVTSDGLKLFVTDLGHNRVLIWNSLPTSTAQAADIVLGQKDFSTSLANNSPALCASNGTVDDKPTYPGRCGATLDFPRFALSDGRRLFIADGGNDRVLIYNTLPTASGQTADVVLGQVRPDVNNTSDFFAELISASDTLRTPTSLAFDGSNLYVADPFNRRVMVYTPGEQLIPNTGVRNAASREIFSVGAVTFGGTIKKDDEVTVKVGKRDEEVSFKYKVKEDDTFLAIVTDLFNQINANGGDPNVLATINRSLPALVLTARVAGAVGDTINLSTELSAEATLTATTSGATLTGGQDAGKIAPGTIVTLLGDNLSDTTASVDLNTGRDLPKELGGVQVYFDGIRAPLTFVSPGEVRAQMPWEVVDATSVTAWIRTRRVNGEVTVTTAVGVPIIKQNPGIFAEDGADPRPGIAYHGSSFAQATVSVDGTAKEGDKARIFINDRRYEYVVKTGDELAQIRDGLVEAINAGGGDPEVVAFSAGVFARVRLRARVEGPAGNGIPVRTEARDSADTEAAQVILSATNVGLCCANVGGSRVTVDNPAVPGETIIVYAVGLGLVEPGGFDNPLIAGQPYNGPEYNEPVEFVSSLVGGRTANVIFARLVKGQVGIYEVQLELNSDLPTNDLTQLTIAQSFQVSNIVTLPVKRTDQ